MDWSHIKMYSQWIRSELYEVHRYFVPRALDRRLKFIRKYFRVMNRDNIPYVYKRRKNPVEYVETAVMALGRLDMICKLDIPIVAGSTYLAETPWGVFGDVSEINSKVSFRDFEDIASYYREIIVKGDSSPECFHFRTAASLPWQLAEAYQVTPHFIVSIAICLLYDLLLNCGPDCEELYDLFSNDCRVTSKTIKLSEWQELRCKVMGRHGGIKNKPYKYKVGQIYEPYVPLISATKIEEISKSDDLAAGEKVHIMKCSPPLEDHYDDGTEDHYDDGTIAPETDVAYVSRVSNATRKYSYLGLSVQEEDGLCINVL